MTEYREDFRKLCRKLLVLIVLMGGAFFMTSESRAQNDPIACQHDCFLTYFACCQAGCNPPYCASCDASCVQDYYTCGSGCGIFTGNPARCQQQEFNYFNYCITGADFCAAGDTACCYQAASDDYQSCLYP